MSDSTEVNVPLNDADQGDDSILKKRGRIRRAHSDPLNIPVASATAAKIFGNDPMLNDSTTAELLCCLAASSSASYDFENGHNKVKAQRLKSRSKDDSDMNLQTASQDTFVGRFLQDKRSASDTHVFNKNHTFSTEDENYLLSLLPSISVDTSDGLQHDLLVSADRMGLRKELSELSDTADLLKGLSGSFDFTRLKSGTSDFADLMPPPISLPAHKSNSSNALDSARTNPGDGIASYAFPTRQLPKKSPSLYMSPSRMPLSKAAAMNNAMLEQRKLQKEKSLNSAAALNEFGMIQLAHTDSQPQQEEITAQSASDVSTVGSSLGSSSTSSGTAMHVSDHSSSGGGVGGGGAKDQHSPPQHSSNKNGSNPKLVQRVSGLSQMDSSSADPAGFDAVLQRFRDRSDSQRSLNSSSWSINSGISSMSIGDLTRSTDHTAAEHIRGSKNYPRLVQMLNAPSTDEMEQTVSTAQAEASTGKSHHSSGTGGAGGGVLHNSHAAAHGGNHSANSHIVHHHMKEPLQKQMSRTHEPFKKQEAVSTRYPEGTMNPNLWVDTSATSATPQTHQLMQPPHQMPVPVTAVGTDNTPYTTYYIPAGSGIGSSGSTSSSTVGGGVYQSSMDPSCLPCVPNIEYSYSHSLSSGGTPRNFPSLSISSETYSYNASAVGAGGLTSMDDTSVGAMSSLAYSHSSASSASSATNSSPSLSSYATTYNASTGGYYPQVNVSGYGGYGSSSSPMASSNTLNYLAEIKGENNLYKEKPKPQRYVGRSSYRCGKCGMPKVNHVCTVVDTLITGVATQTAQPSWDPRAKPIASERVLTISRRKNITDDFDYDEHHNRYNLTQPRRDIFAKKQQAVQRQMELQQQHQQQYQASMSMYSMDGYSPTNYQQQLMYQELLARTRSNSTMYSGGLSQYSSHSNISTPSVTPTAAQAVAKMSLGPNTNSNVNNSTFNFSGATTNMN